MATATFNTLVIGNKYNLSFLAPALLGSALQNATLMGIVDYSVAMSLNNVTQTHENVKPYLPTNTKELSAYKFLIFMRNGVRTVACTAWIDERSLEEVTRKVATVTLEILSEDDKRKISEVLQLAGYSVLTVV